MPNYIEPIEELSGHDRDIHRTLNSLKEEIDAIEWYHQRAVTTTDIDMKAILVHNLEEEIEHACMLLEWLRRNMAGWDECLKIYLFTTQSVTAIEDHTPTDSSKAKEHSLDDLGIRNLKNISL